MMIYVTKWNMASFVMQTGVRTHGHELKSEIYGCYVIESSEISSHEAEDSQLWRKRELRTYGTKQEEVIVSEEESVVSAWQAPKPEAHRNKETST